MKRRGSEIIAYGAFLLSLAGLIALVAWGMPS